MSPESPNLEGRWQMIRANLAGEPAPELVVTRTELILAAGAYEVRFAGQVMDQGTFEAAESAGRKTMVLRGMAGTNAGRTIPCIYQLKGDRLRVCYGVDGALPESFNAMSPLGRYVATYNRVILERRL